jgi:hypothetical protein
MVTECATIRGLKLVELCKNYHSSHSCALCMVSKNRQHLKHLKFPQTLNKFYVSIIATHTSSKTLYINLLLYVR